VSSGMHFGRPRVRVLASNILIHLPIQIGILECSLDRTT
jgi:hypothetical protein